MKIKTSELVGAVLDWAVSTCQNLDYWQPEYGPSEPDYSTDWAQGGPIIERVCVAIYASGACSVEPKNPDYWVAEILETDGMVIQYGPTPLIAAMRCYVASKLGAELDVPDELT